MHHHETWETNAKQVAKYRGHALLLDTGGASNLAGAYSSKDYEEGCLLPWKFIMFGFTVYNVLYLSPMRSAMFTGFHSLILI